MTDLLLTALTWWAYGIPAYFIVVGILISPEHYELNGGVTLVVHSIIWPFALVFGFYGWLEGATVRPKYYFYVIVLAAETAGLYVLLFWRWLL